MKENMYANDIHYLLREAAKGNARCCYRAGLDFEGKGYKLFYSQTQFRRAAELGYTAAQRRLGILGLCHLLRTEDSGFSEDVFNEDCDEALDWLREAANANDKVSELILVKCRQLGVGMEADEEGVEDEIAEIVPYLSEDEVAAVARLFEYIRIERDEPRGAKTAAELRRGDVRPRNVPAQLRFVRSTILREFAS